MHWHISGNMVWITVVSTSVHRYDSGEVLSYIYLLNLFIERKEAILPFGQQRLSLRFGVKSLTVALVLGISSWKSL